MSSFAPRISVLLPVFNGAPYLKAAIDSVLTQTFSDFELIILNDGSTDDSANIIRGYSDARIRYFERPNMGLPATLNKGASYARGEFLFRQDQDDLSRFDRFELQVNYLDNHPDVSLLGTWSRIFIHGDSATNYRYHAHPVEHSSIVLCTIFDSAFVHSSVAIRRRVFEALGGYCCDLGRQPPEDFELWSRVCKSYIVANVPEFLVDYREVHTSMSRALKKELNSRLLFLAGENLSYWLSKSSFSDFSFKLAEIYHMDGFCPTESLDCSIIDGALTHIEKSLVSCGEPKSLEFGAQMQRIRQQLMRNYWLGKSRVPIFRYLMKGFFRGLQRVYG